MAKIEKHKKNAEQSLIENDTKRNTQKKANEPPPTHLLTYPGPSRPKNNAYTVVASVGGVGIS